MFKEIYKMKRIVRKLRNGSTLRDDGLSYGDCREQLTYLLFLKMADERAAMVLIFKNFLTVPKLLIINT